MSDFPDLEISHYPRMERPGERSTLVIPTGPEWTEQMGILLEVTKIPPANSVQRRFRKVGRGQNKRSMPAKHCAPGITAYTVPQGSSRGRRTAEMAPWNWLPLDLDAVPLGINETLEIVRKAIDVRAVAWTTWSAKDGHASVRVLIPLPHPVKLPEVIPLWWAARQRLAAAGLPEESSKGGEPANDSRALDGRLFFLPAVPETLEEGEEGWGGIVPRGYISKPDEPLLDIDSWTVEGNLARTLGEAEHRKKWPSVPLPGVGGGHLGKASASHAPNGFFDLSFDTPSSGAIREDFSTVKMYGEPEGDLKSWAAKHLPNNETEILIGSVFDPDIWGPGDRATHYASLILHRGDDGHLWAHDYRSGENYVDISHREKEEETFGVVEQLAGEIDDDLDEIDAEDRAEFESPVPEPEVPASPPVVEPEPEPVSPPAQEPEPEEEFEPEPEEEFFVEPTGPNYRDIEIHTTYAEEKDRTHDFLYNLTHDRDIALNRAIGWWEAFDKVEYLVRNGDINEAVGKATMKGLRERILNKLREEA